MAFAAANALQQTRKKSGPGFCSGAAKVINEKLLWSSWRWGPLALFLSALRLPLPALSRSRCCASWLAARLTIGTLPSLSSTSRFAWTCTCRRRARLASLCAAATLTSTWPGWSRCSAAPDLGRSTTVLLWHARRSARPPRAWSRALSAF